MKQVSTKYLQTQFKFIKFALQIWTVSFDFVLIKILSWMSYFDICIMLIFVAAFHHIQKTKNIFRSKSFQLNFSLLFWKFFYSPSFFWNFLLAMFISYPFIRICLFSSDINLLFSSNLFWNSIVFCNFLFFFNFNYADFVWF